MTPDNEKTIINVTAENDDKIKTALKVGDFIVQNIAVCLIVFGAVVMIWHTELTTNLVWPWWLVAAITLMTLGFLLILLNWHRVSKLKQLRLKYKFELEKREAEWQHLERMEKIRREVG